MSSIRKTPEHAAYGLLPDAEGAATEAAADEAAADEAAADEAAEEVAEAAEAAEEAAVSGLDPSGSASSSSSLRSRLRLRERQRSATRPGSDYIYFEEEPGRDERPPTCSHATKPGALRPISPSCRPHRAKFALKAYLCAAQLTRSATRLLYRTCRLSRFVVSRRVLRGLLARHFGAKNESPTVSEAKRQECRSGATGYQRQCDGD
jgi:hypothetical protein